MPDEEAQLPDEIAATSLRRKPPNLRAQLADLVLQLTKLPTVVPAASASRVGSHAPMICRDHAARFARRLAAGACAAAASLSRRSRMLSVGFIVEAHVNLTDHHDRVLLPRLHPRADGLVQVDVDLAGIDVETDQQMPQPR